MNTAFRSLAFSLIAIGFTQAGWGDMVSVDASRDNTLYESFTGILSNGAGDHFFAGQTGEGDIRRGLLYFDIAAVIPNGATVTNVTLTLHMSRTASGNNTVSLHSILADWGEGASDAPNEEGSGATAEPGDATWLNTFFPSNLWATAGGDFNPLASASTTVGGIGFYSWNSAAMTGDIQDWLDDPVNNFGWMVVGDESAPTTTKRFDTRENSNALFRPVLQVEFTRAIPEPACWLVCSVAAMGLSILRRRR